ncbi:hypothetical protein DIPPA_11044 [Diplonema papillatum]|nr:hypothetical protein DIPPA_11044 [Diplonema papillatum]
MTDPGGPPPHHGRGAHDQLRRIAAAAADSVISSWAADRAPSKAAFAGQLLQALHALTQPPPGGPQGPRETDPSEQHAHLALKRPAPQADQEAAEVGSDGEARSPGPGGAGLLIKKGSSRVKKSVSWGAPLSPGGSRRGTAAASAAGQRQDADASKPRCEEAVHHVEDTPVARDSSGQLQEGTDASKPRCEEAVQHVDTPVARDSSGQLQEGTDASKPRCEEAVHHVEDTPVARDSSGQLQEGTDASKPRCEEAVQHVDTPVARDSSGQLQEGTDASKPRREEAVQHVEDTSVAYASSDQLQEGADALPSAGNDLEVASTKAAKPRREEAAQHVEDTSVAYASSDQPRDGADALPSAGNDLEVALTKAAKPRSEEAVQRAEDTSEAQDSLGQPREGTDSLPSEGNDLEVASTKATEPQVEEAAQRVEDTSVTGSLGQLRSGALPSEGDEQVVEVVEVVEVVAIKAADPRQEEAVQNTAEPSSPRSSRDQPLWLDGSSATRGSASAEAAESGAGKEETEPNEAATSVPGAQSDGHRHKETVQDGTDTSVVHGSLGQEKGAREPQTAPAITAPGTSPAAQQQAVGTPAEERASTPPYPQVRCHRRGFLLLDRVSTSQRHAGPVLQSLQQMPTARKFYPVATRHRLSQVAAHGRQQCLVNP